MTNLELVVNSNGVSICKDCGSYINAFIDIYIDKKDTPSLFKTVDDAVLFAEIILKLLEAIDYDSK